MGDHFEVLDGRCVVTLAASWTHTTRRDCGSCSRHAVDDARGGRLLLDLTQVSFLDSTVLGCIVGLLRRAREADGDLDVVLPRGNAERIFQITGLDTILTTYPTRAAALET